MNEEILEAAYSLNISDEDIAAASKIINPLSIQSYSDRTALGLKQLRVMSTPEYLFWASKLLLNLDMTPMHALVLEELWDRPFPMLIASRGFAKCVVADTLVITDYGIKTIKDLVPKDLQGKRQECKARLVGEGSFTNTEYAFYNGEKYTKIISTRSGRKIECSTNHPLRTIFGGGINWLEAKEQKIGNYLIVRRNIPWVASNDLTKERAFELGLNVTKKTKEVNPDILSASKECLISYIQGLLNTKVVSKKHSAYTIGISGTTKFLEQLQLILLILGVNSFKIEETLEISDYDYSALYKIGALDKTRFKEIPTEKISEVHRFVPICLINHLSYALLQYARIYRKNNSEYSALNKTVENILQGKTFLTYSELKIFAKLFENVDNIKEKKEYIQLQNILQNDYYFDEIISIDDSYDKTYDVHLIKDHSYISNGFISHNTFTMAQLALLKMRLIPGTQVIITGSGFRQARLVFEYMEKICNNAPVFCSTMSSDDGPKREQDRLTFKIGDSYTYAVPIGDDGEKIRGLRSNLTIVDEFNCVGPDTLIETKQGLIRIGDDIDHLQLDVLTGNKDIPYEKPDKYIVTPPSDCYKILLENGMIIRCSPWHKLMTTEGWKTPEDLHHGSYIECRNYYKFPRKSPQGINKNVAYLMGLCLSKADITSKDTISIKTDNEAIINKLLYVYNFKRDPEDASLFRLKNRFIRQELFKLGLGYKPITNRKIKIPSCILRSNKECVFYFLKGLLNQEYLVGDVIKYSSYNKYICSDLLVLLYKLDINAKLRRLSGRIHKSNKYTLTVTKTGTKRLLNPDPPEVYKRKKLKYLKVKECRKLKKKMKLYDYHLPKTHSFYGNICKNHNSVPIHIYETVISNFGTVSRDPVQKVYSANKRRKLIKEGKWTVDMEMTYNQGQTNQQILSGTAGYAFQHFAAYYERYKNIIMSGGDRDILIDLVGEEQVDKIDWRSFSIIKIPYELMPEGFGDDETIARAKATIESDSYKREFGTVFTKDSEGFFKRTLIESCVAKESNPIVINGESVVFSARLQGDPDKKYIMGVDPAFKHDNLAIVISELNNNHSRIVYCWTINEKKHKAKIKAGIITEHDYWQYCVVKIRELVKNFNIVRILMDAGGGGTTLHQALAAPRDQSLVPIFEIRDPNKRKDTDDMNGLHILEMCQFSNNAWLSAANHGLKFDLEHKLVLFPNYDAVEIAIALQMDKLRIENEGLKFDDRNFELYDTLEDCLKEIEELKDELTNIVITRTATNLERWDTPDVKSSTKKGVMKKDRYSALLMANMGVRNYGGEAEVPKYMSIGGIVGQIAKEKDKDKSLYQHKPRWWNPDFTGMKVR